jgi:hypothetical protein
VIQNGNMKYTRASLVGTIKLILLAVDDATTRSPSPATAPLARRGFAIECSTRNQSTSSPPCRSARVGAMERTEDQRRRNGPGGGEKRAAAQREDVGDPGGEKGPGREADEVGVTQGRRPARSKRAPVQGARGQACRRTRGSRQGGEPGVQPGRWPAPRRPSGRARSHAAGSGRARARRVPEVQPAPDTKRPVFGGLAEKA